MKLTLEYTNIKDIQFGDKTKIDKGVLTVNTQELKDRILKDPFIKDVRFDIARPGESVRIINIVDMIEPRAKLEGNDWAGVLSDFSVTPGEGTTRCLKGMSIIIQDTNHFWKGARIGNLDMIGPAAELTDYSQLCHLTIHCIKADNSAIDQWDFAASIRKACYGAGVYLAKAAFDLKPDDSEVLDNETLTPGLPNIGYYQQVYAAQYQYENVPEPIFYGFPIPDSFPLVIQPSEVMDGAVAWGHGYHMAETYAQQNHAIIMGLFRRHGKELNFAGYMLGTTNTDDHRRGLAAMMIANTMKDVFHCDGVLMTKTFGGASHVDEGMAASECEKRGIAAVPMIQALNQNTNLSHEMLFDDTNLKTIVQSGMYFQEVVAPPMDRIIGAKDGGDGKKALFIASQTYDKQYAGETVRNSAFNLVGWLCQTGNAHAQGMDF
ncbi:MAG: glycine/sarcosine/betaine reductase component B subunit [Oscillospiraceae bacterium]